MILGPIYYTSPKIFDNIVFDNQKHGSTSLEPGSGINVKFESKIKPREELIKTIIREVQAIIQLHKYHKLRV